MSRYYYAAYTPYGTQVTYETGAYQVFRFASKAERDKWVNADDYHSGNPHREAISRNIARRILGKYAVAVPVQNYERMEPDPYHSHEW